MGGSVPARVGGDFARVPHAPLAAELVRDPQGLDAVRQRHHVALQGPGEQAPADLVGLVAGDTGALELAEKYLAQRLTSTTAVNAWSTSSLLAALDLYLHNKVLVVTEGQGREELLATARKAYCPTLSIAGPWAQASILEGKTSDDDRARAFVCTGPTCSPPVTDAAALVQLLAVAS